MTPDLETLADQLRARGLLVFAKSGFLSVSTPSLCILNLRIYQGGIEFTSSALDDETWPILDIIRAWQTDADRRAGEHAVTITLPEIVFDGEWQIETNRDRRRSQSEAIHAMVMPPGSDGFHGYGATIEDAIADALTEIRRIEAEEAAALDAMGATEDGDGSSQP